MASQTVLFQENFNDGDLDNNPPWERFFDITLIKTDTTQFLSAPSSCRISTSNQMSAIETFSNIYSSSLPFEISFNVYVASMGDEAIPLGVRGSSSVFFLFFLPGKVQLTVLKSKTGFVPENLDVPGGYVIGQWQNFKIAYDGIGTTLLSIDGVAKGTVSQPYVDDPSILQIGNKHLPHTSTFYVDDIRITTSVPKPAAAKVYVVLCSDADTWDGLNVNNYANFLRFGLFSSPTGNAATVIDPLFRNKLRDSNNNPLVFTWFMLEGSMVAKNTNPEVTHPWISNLEMMTRYHGNALKQVGDELSFHYHNWIWNDPDGNGIHHWNQSSALQEYKDDFLQTLGHMIIDGNLMPTSFRSGWHYMDNEWECLLDSLIPYRFENATPSKHVDTTEPIDNMYDWSRAPLEWIPYHPAPGDYQSKGSLRGWETRCLYMKSVTTTSMAIPFSRAMGGQDQVVTIWSHLAESDFPQQIILVDSVLHRTALYFPDVVFEYATATGSMQRWRNISDTIPPQIQTTVAHRPDGKIIVISTNEPIWQDSPLVFLKGESDSLIHVPAEFWRNLTWRSTVGTNLSAYHTAGIGVTDTSGNSATKLISLLVTDAHEESKTRTPTFRLNEAYPNPFNSSTTITFELPRETFVRIIVYDILGREVRTLVNGLQPGGTHRVRFDASSLQSGIYLFRVDAGEWSGVKKLVYVR
ncbi:MAG TPA: T9SS type A sorting domain-containing protein [Bacteroidota bacterium]|nr:T9SS type A sorting domain-containing protein [Bacteroidota bacterium]